MVAPRRTRAHQRQRVTPRLLNGLARRLVRQFHPEQVILFGSQARGTAGPDSDVDLMVILPIERAQKAELEIAMGVALRDVLVPLDIVVVTPDEVDRFRNTPGTLIRPALREGRVLYARG